MPSWWKKSSSKELKKKGSKENIFDALNLSKWKASGEEKGKFKSSRRGSNHPATDKDIGQDTDYTPIASTIASRSQSFAERNGKPLPLPSAHNDLGISHDKTSEIKSGKSSPRLPFPSADRAFARSDNGEAATVLSASVSSLSSEGSNEATDLHLDNTSHHDYCKEHGVAAMGSPVPDSFGGSGLMHGAKFSKPTSRSKRDIQKHGSLLSSHRNASKSQQRGSSIPELPSQLHVPLNGLLLNGPDNSISSSPPRSQPKVYGSEQLSSPGSGHNSMGADMVGYPSWQPWKGSPEHSPLPSPRRSAPSSRVQSGAVTPLHPRAAGAAAEPPTNWPEEGKHTGHPLPLPPLCISNQSQFSGSVPSSATLSRSPGRADNPPSPGPRWKKGKLLGRGTFGHVYAGLNNETGMMCAMKEVTLFSDDPKSKESAKQLSQEIAVLSRLRHKNIVQYYGGETVYDRLYIYLEYVSGGSIHKLLQEYGQFGEPVIRSYTRQILAGLAYLHNQSTVHRDIKGANILVDTNGQVKLADFGMAKHITAYSCPLSFKGSPYWMAPEVIKNMNGYNLAVDIWSLGCTVIEMATAKPPWSQYEGVAAMFKIGNSKELPTMPENLSEEGKDFVRLCLQRDPSSRPSALQLLEHPFVQDAAPYVKLDGYAPNSEIPPSFCNIDQSRHATEAGYSRNMTVADADNALRSKGKLASQQSSEHLPLPKIISMPVSPTGTPLIQPRSPQNRNGMKSISPISTPTRSGAASPLTGGFGTIPFVLARQHPHVDEVMGNFPRSPKGLYGNGCLNGVYHDPRQEFYPGTPRAQTPPPEGSMMQDQLSPEHNILGRVSGPFRVANFEVQRQYGYQDPLAEHVTKQFGPAKLPEPIVSPFRNHELRGKNNNVFS